MAPMQTQPKVIEDEATAKAFGDLLDRHLIDLQNAKDETDVAELLTGGTIQLINTFEALKCSTWQEGWFDIIDKVTDIFMAGNEAGKEAKRCLILSITESCMDVIISPAVTLIHKIEILKSFNTVLENCSATTKSDLLGRTQFTEKLSLLFKSISQVGDYEVQVCIIEFMFRIVPRSMRKEYLKNILVGSEQWVDFLDIRDSNFEIDCRHFLNKLNKQNICPTRVYSYPAEFVSIDGIKLYKPSDDGYDAFWVDFNEGSKRVGIFCEANFLSSQQSQDAEQLWETVSIWAQDVKKYSCSAQGKLWKAIIELKPGAEMLSNKEADNLSHLVIIVVPQEYDLKRTIEDILTIHHKASSVDIPIHIVQKPDTQASSSTALSENVVPRKTPTLSQQQGDRSVPSVVRSKISIPSEPMTTPASSVITSNSEYPTFWQEMQERQRQQKEELAKVLDRSGCEEKGKTGVTEDCDRLKGKKKSTLEVSNTNNIDKILVCGKSNTRKSDSEMKSQGSSKNVSVASNIQNEIKDSCKVNEKIKDISENTKDGKPSRSRSQAKVKASEKCTDMTYHHMDARASDAHVNVVNSPVTESGVSNFCLQHAQKVHGRDTRFRKWGTKGTQRDSQEQGAGDLGKAKNRRSQPVESTGPIFNAASDNKHDCQPPNTPVKSLRSRKRTGAPVSVQTTEFDTQRTQSDSNPSQLDIIPGTLPGAQQKASRQLMNKRESSKRQMKKNQASIHGVEILDSTASSGASINREIKSDSKKNKPKQINNESRSSSSKDDSHKSVTAKSKVQNIISPGNTSVDDFKPSTNFRSLRSANRKVTEKTDSLTAKDQSKAGGKGISLAHKRKASCELISGTGKGDAENAVAKTLKDFLPMLQEKEKSAPERTLKSKGAHSEMNDICQQANVVSADLNSVSNKSCTKSKEAKRASKVEEPKESKSADNDNSMPYESVSSSSSGELFVEIEASKKTQEECDVIKETQFEMSPPFSFDAVEVTVKGKKKASANNPKQNEHLPKKSKLDSKFPDGSGDCMSSHLDMQISSNLENSYVFSKHPSMKAVSFRSYRLECEEGKIENTKIKIKSPITKRKVVEVGGSCKKKEENFKLDQTVAKPGSPAYEGDKHEKVYIKKTLKNVKTVEPSEVSSCSVLMNNQQTKVDKEQGQTLSKTLELTVPTRKLRTRNKTVSYKECDSDCISCSNVQVKNASQAKIKKSEKITAQNVVLNISAIPAWNNVSEVSPDEIMKKSKQDSYSVSRLGSQAPKKSMEGHETKRQIWTSHRMERTVTSYSKSVYSLSSDPYDFEVECKKRATETATLAPLRSSFFAKQNSEGKIHAESDRSNYKKKDGSKSQLQSGFSSELLMRNTATHGENILKSEQYVNKQRNSYLYANNKHCTQSDNKKNLATNELLMRNTATHGENIPKAKQSVNKQRNSSTYAHNKQCRQSDNKKNSTGSAVVRHTSGAKENKNLSLGSDSDERDIISDRESSKFGLFASQCETQKSDSGLVFPHLDDSIPCTPITPQQEEDVCEGTDITERKSLVSELSWLAQAKRPLEKCELKKGKTYKRNKPANIKHQADNADEDLEFSPLYSSLYCKQTSKTPDKLDKTPKPKKRDGTPGKRKLFSPLDIVTVSGKSSLVSHTESKEQSDQLKESSPVKDHQKEGTLASILTNSTQKLGSFLGNKGKRNLSFRSPSIQESPVFELSETVTEDNYDLNKSKNKKSEMSISNSEQPCQSLSNLRHQSSDSWSLISSKIDQQLQDVIGRLSGSADYQIYSGPSSCRRPTRSELKRKYPDVSATTDSGDAETDTEYNFSDHAEGALKSAFIPKKLFKSDVTPVRPDQSTLAVKQTGQGVKVLSDTQICNQKYSSKNSKKHTNKKMELETKSCKQKISATKQRKKHAPVIRKFEKTFTSTPHIRSELASDMCSPEKARSCAESSGEPLFKSAVRSSPFVPLDLTSSSSPVIGFSEKSSSETDFHINEAAPQTTLLDGMRKELIKFRVSQVCEEPEPSVEATALDLNETVSVEFDSLKEFLIKKRTKNTPLDSDDVQGAVKSTHQYITAFLETEQSKRMNAIEKFQCVAEDVFTRMNRDLKDIHENEVKVNLLWAQEMEKIRRYTLSQERELKRLKKAHEVLICELQKAYTEGETAQKSLKAAMKQDLGALQRKLLAKYNEHALEAMRRCLQMSLLS